MSFDLVSDSGQEMTVSNSGWRYLMEFATAHGFAWPKREDGEDADALNGEQARELADAIEKGMGPGTTSEIATRVSEQLTKLLVIPSNSESFRDDPIPMTARSIEYWREFTAFARAGGFSVDF